MEMKIYHQNLIANGNFKSINVEILILTLEWKKTGKNTQV